jgi:hypothetical protein
MSENFQRDCSLDEGIEFQEPVDYRKCISVLVAPVHKLTIEGIFFEGV